jgi:hypothetical protein
MGAHRKTGRLLRVFAVPLLLGGVLTGLGSTAASALTCQAWTGGQPLNPNDTGSGDGLTGVDQLSACNVWVAGGSPGGTLIEHWTGGSTWTVVPSPSPGAGLNFLTSINGISPNDIWAVGTDSNADGSVEQGLILHWNGTSWLQSPSPDPGKFIQLTAVHEISANDAWAVGTVSDGSTIQTLTLHWDGTSWTQKPSPSPGIGNRGELTGVTATSGGDVWAVGDYLSSEDPSDAISTLVMHWDGTSWKQVASPNPEPDIINQLTGVSAVSPDDAWAVGFFADGTTDHTLIAHWDGTSWTRVPSPDPFEDDNLSGVAATSANSAVAVGSGQTAAKQGRGVTLALRWDGTAWTQAPSIQVSNGDSLSGVASISSTEAWAVGFSAPTPTKTLAFHFK